MRAGGLRGNDDRGLHRDVRRGGGAARSTFRHEAIPHVPGVAHQGLYGGGSGTAGGGVAAGLGGGGGAAAGADVSAAGSSPVATGILRVWPFRQTVICRTCPTRLRETS